MSKPKYLKVQLPTLEEPCLVDLPWDMFKKDHPNWYHLSRPELFQYGMFYQLFQSLDKFKFIPAVMLRLRRLKTDFIGIDIDYSTKNFVRAYLGAIRLFPKKQVKVELSSSRLGFHIRICLKTPISLIESLIYRCVLNDCSNRLKLSIARMVSNAPGNHHWDLIFDVKNGKKVKPFNMERLLRPHRKKVEWILNNWGDIGMEEEIKKIADDIDDKLPKKELWTAGFNFKGEKLREIVVRICESAKTQSALKGESPGFRFMVKKNVHPDWDYVFAVFGRDANHAYKRATYVWFNAIKDMDKEVYTEIKKMLGIVKNLSALDETTKDKYAGFMHLLEKVGISLYWKPKRWC